MCPHVRLHVSQSVYFTGKQLEALRSEHELLQEKYTKLMEEHTTLKLEVTAKIAEAFDNGYSKAEACFERASRFMQQQSAQHSHHSHQFASLGRPGYGSLSPSLSESGGSSLRHGV